MGWNQPTRLNSPIKVDTPSRVSASTMRACASFGLIVNHQTDAHTKTDPPNEQLLVQIADSDVVLVSGASGAGKSCMLRGIIEAIETTNPGMVHVVDERMIKDHRHRSMVDLFDGPLEKRVSTLSHAGLAEPRLWAMPASCISVGERSRLILALTMHRAHPGDVIVADELATPLDRANAYALARTMRRWVKAQRIALIAATAHEDMESMLEPDLVLDMNTRTTRPACTPIDQPIRIEHGTTADYQTLAHLHYRASKPATHTLVLRAMRQTPHLGKILAGVLVVSMPTLNGAWRDRAWAGIFSTGDKSLNAKRINEHLRCISRVIVEPRSRGLGVASSLVRHYLNNPQTQATEAIAAMGAVCPFFERSGMISYELFPARVDLRLMDALEHENTTLTDLIESVINPKSLIARELITWSKARKIIGSGAPNAQTIGQLAHIAACRLLANPRAYAHVYSNGDDGDGTENIS